MSRLDAASIVPYTDSGAPTEQCEGIAERVLNALLNSGAVAVVEGADRRTYLRLPDGQVYSWRDAFEVASRSVAAEVREVARTQAESGAAA